MKRTEYWHGTGKLHYKHIGNSKYEGVTDDVNNSLASILVNGLEPRHDLYSDILCANGETNTVSITQQRMYARVYACMFREATDALHFEYGSSRFWHLYYFASMFGSMLFDLDSIFELLRAKRKMHQRGAGQHDNAGSWISSFCNNEDNGKTAGSVLWSFSRAFSDIQGNHPLIIGVAKAVVRPIPLTIRRVEMFESRHANTIPPDAFTHIQVPLCRVNAVRKEIHQLGLSQITVVPIEFAELIDSDEPFHRLVRPHRVSR